jgi:hypothetical protein
MSASRRFIRTEAHRRIERARVNDVEDQVNLSDAEKSTVGFTVPEKKAFYAAREDLLYLPLQGENGGIMQDIAKSVECSRNYVLYTIWPRDPGTLFNGRSIKYKAIWHELKRRVDLSEILKSYKGIIQTFINKGDVEFKAFARDAKFVVSRLQILGYAPVSTVAKTTPRTYRLTDPRRNSALTSSV